MAKKKITPLINKLWKIFSEYIRLRDSYDGYCNCFTCGANIDWKYETDAGHFMSRKNQATLFHPLNVHAQCKSCNGFKAGMQYEYGKRLNVVYGEGTAETLQRMSKQSHPFRPEWLEALIEVYKLKLEQIRKEKL